MDDEQYMRMALELAKKGRTSPNPKVGCIIVNDEGEIIGKGYHKRAGLPHAEVEAIEDTRNRGLEIQNATMYLTLEPCSYSGKGKRTPACTNAVLESGVSRLVVAMRDPNPRVRGRGVRFLKGKGIKVEVGLLEQEAKDLNKPYIKWITKKVPYLFVKVATTLDGRIATKTGDSKWISGKKSLEFAHELRAQVDAIMVGAGTIETDDPRLTTRIKGKPDPIRIIVDSDLCISEKSKFMRNAKNVILATGRGAKKSRIEKFKKTGARVIIAGEKMVGLKKLMKEVGTLGIQSVMLEGGSELIGSAIEAGIVDKLYFVIAPKIIGGEDAKGPVGGKGIGRMRDALKLKNMKVKKMGDDLLIEADF
jgi:diaminohydroxyphosphoribosylaminopyrimidine deaminase/5-amino-6-(5-phosphoribosylamino)uracil reductase